MEILKYNSQRDFEKLMDVIKSEGDDWSCYSSDSNQDIYKKALEKSMTYVAYSGDELCGYSRSLDDYSFYIFVCDLLVHKQFRGNKIGMKLVQIGPLLSCIGRAVQLPFLSARA